MPKRSMKQKGIPETLGFMGDNKPQVFTPLTSLFNPSALHVLGHVWMGGTWTGNMSGCTLVPDWTSWEM